MHFWAPYNIHILSIILLNTHKLHVYLSGIKTGITPPIRLKQALQIKLPTGTQLQQTIISHKTNIRKVINLTHS
jgi:hypothetical protein